MILQIMAKCHAESAACGISAQIDLVFRKSFYFPQPVKCCDGIFKCRRERIFRCNAVINGKHIHSFSRFRVQHSETSISIVDLSHITAAVQLQQDTIFSSSFRFGQIFHRKKRQMDFFHLKSRRTSPRRFHDLLPHLSILEFLSDEVITRYTCDQFSYKLTFEACFFFRNFDHI